MTPISIKFAGYQCFKNEWSGFDVFKPISVIIGRNNSGKSQLLDLIELLLDKPLCDNHFSMNCSATLTEDFLKGVFNKAVSGGLVGGNHWEDHGLQAIGKEVEWTITDKGCQVNKQKSPWNDQKVERVQAERLRMLNAGLKGVNCHLRGLKCARILADRDISPEAASAISLKSNGVGATNVIYQFTTSANLDEGIVNVDLVNGLRQIFGNDGHFSGIKIQRLGEIDSTQDKAVWEVFLREPRKGLIPLSKSGSGLKTVILVLLNLFVLPEIHKKARSQFVFAFEELENNLHPALLRRLFKFIADYVVKEECVLFLTTHSSVALDFFGPRADTQIIQVSHDGETARTRTVQAHFDQVNILSDLGCRPSDLLQANGVIWLEGPSDRIYLNRLLELYSDGELSEGREYQCAFYGGSVLAQSTFAAPDEGNDELANLLRINSNVAVICDGDRTADSGEGSQLKDRAARIAKEVESVPNAFCWITEAKEIETYVPGSVWANVYGTATAPDPGKFDSFPSTPAETSYVFKNFGRKSFDKCEVASKVVPTLTIQMLANRFELAEKIVELIKVIKSWNA